MAEASPYILGMDFDIDGKVQNRDYTYVSKPEWTKNTGQEAFWKSAMACCRGLSSTCAPDEWTYK